MSVSTDAILFYGYCWHDEAHSPWEIDRGDNDDEGEGDDHDWEARYACLKGCLPPSTPYPERTVTPTPQNNYDSTPKDYTSAEKAIIKQHTTYWEAKGKIVDASPCLIDSHCSASCPMPYVAVRKSVVSSHRGYASRIASLDIDPAWNAVLAEFCKTMDIKVGNKKPGWWLVSDWSE